VSEPIEFEAKTARMALPMLFAGQAQKEFTVNEALLRTDIALQCAVEDEVSSPPSAPAIGQVWLIGTSPTGIFSGRAGEIAGWTADGWRFIAPAAGFVAYDRTAQCFRVFSGTWRKPEAPTAATGGGTIDVEARAAIANILQTLISAGVFAPD
jgi:hypothetical protein